MKTISKPIQVIAKFAENGKPEPVKFKLKDDKDAYSIIKVNRIVTSGEEKLEGD